MADAPTKRVDDASTSNDVGVWGDRPTPGYTRPFMVDGEPVELDKLPKFGEEDPGSSMGDLDSTGSGGDFGDIYESARVPLRR